MKRWVVGMTALGLACGGDSTGPSASSVTGVAGDNQSAPRGAQLPVPLSFTALGSDGQPIANIAVTWSATPTGAAAFSPTTTTTDANGVASTNVTLGSTLGSITIQATLAGVDPVVYHATVLDPCLIFTPIIVGQTINAALTPTDCQVVAQGIFKWFYDYYGLDLANGQQNVRINMHGSGSFDDTFIDFYRGSGSLLALDDDSILGQQGARNSQVDIILSGDSSYIIGANSFDTMATGSYALAVEARTSALSGCRQVWVTRGISVTDTLKATDCADSSATPKYYEVARMVALSPTVVTLSMKSTVLNPALFLYSVNPGNNARTLVASNDDSLPGSNTNAFIQYTVPASNFFDIIIKTSAGGETGAYTFEVSAATTLSPRIAGAPATGGLRNNWWRDVGIPKRSRR